MQEEGHVEGSIYIIQLKQHLNHFQRLLLQFPIYKPLCPGDSQPLYFTVDTQLTFLELTGSAILLYSDLLQKALRKETGDCQAGLKGHISIFSLALFAFLGTNRRQKGISQPVLYISVYGNKTNVAAIVLYSRGFTQIVSYSMNSYFEEKERHYDSH